MKRKTTLKKINMNPQDTITVDVPLFIRLLEYAREDAQTDMDLHDLADRAIKLGLDGKTLNMQHYNALMGDEEAVNEIRNLQIRAGIIK